ncbi:MAG: excisionase family DNA-binding protein [Nocardioides sp.]|nr:excisionase family DNA-binding protein [Nocardioides sp.]
MKDREWVVPPAVYTVDEAAEALRISKDSLYELIRSAQLRSFKVGRRRLVPIEALGEYVAAVSGDVA